MANASMPRSGHTPLRNTGKVYLLFPDAYSAASA